jgi:glycosyltransferase involved in cell wall biosynthesis
MTTPLITVVIDTYNYGQFIERAIDSVLEQDFPLDRVEVLVVDDGSTDGTGELLGKYGSKIRYLHKSNGGQASAFNVGFAQAGADIVLLLDADDYFLPGKLQRVFEGFQRNPEAGMIYHSMVELHMDSGKFVEPTFACVSGFLPEDRKKLVSFWAYPTSCLAFRRKLLEQLLPIPESLRLQADGYIALLAVLVAPVIAVPEALAVYRIHGRNLYYLDDGTSSAEEKRRRIESHLKLIGEVKAWTRGHGLDRARTRLFLDNQIVRLEDRSFQIDSPGRFRYFVFLVRQNYVNGPFQTWKLSLCNYLIASVSIAVGYQNRRIMDALRSRVIANLQSLVGRS